MRGFKKVERFHFLGDSEMAPFRAATSVFIGVHLWLIHSSNAAFGMTPHSSRSFPGRCTRRWRGLVSVLVAAVTLSIIHAAPVGRIGFQTNDVVVLVGGSSAVAENASGILETALLLAHPGHQLRIRNLAKEGDTVFSRPREVNYPDLAQQVRRTQASVIVVQFGRAEALSGSARPTEFRAAYLGLLDELAQVTPRLVLVTPPPFECGAPPLPDLEPRNPVLDAYSEIIRGIARERGLMLWDVAAALKPVANSKSRRTVDGLQLTSAGERAVAASVVRQIGNAPLADALMRSEGGVWADPRVRELQSAVVEKNRLWFLYVRPTNWAFLGGDRTEQLSSRDHRDPKIRWFPQEIEQFVPLIAEADRQIAGKTPRLQPSSPLR